MSKAHSRSPPIPALYASIRESYPGEIADINETLASNFQDERAFFERAVYGDFVAEKLESRGSAPSLQDALRWRGIDQRHPGTTTEDNRFAGELMSAANGWDASPRKAFGDVLATRPTSPQGVAGIRAYRTNPPFFTVSFSPAHVNASELDSGVALMVKAFPLVGVWSWSSCDGHHLLGKRPKAEVGPATIRLADDWYAKWLASIVSLIGRYVPLSSRWSITENMLTVKGSSATPKFQRAFEQDDDLVRGASFLIRPDVHRAIHAVKEAVPRASTGRERAFKAACRQIENLEFTDDSL